MSGFPEDTRALDAWASAHIAGWRGPSVAKKFAAGQSNPTYLVETADGRTVLRRKRPLDDAIEDNPAVPELSGRDRAFARLLVATTLRRLGQIDALIARCLNMPLAPRAAIVHDILRLGVAQLLFLRTPAHAAVATSVDLAQNRGFVSHKGLVNAVLRRRTRIGSPA